MNLKERLYIGVGTGLFLALLTMTIFHKQPPFWDEVYYLENVGLLKKLGLTNEFLANYMGPAGPTFAVMHYLFSPLTDLGAPLVRLVNVFFLALTMYLTYLTLGKLQGKKSAINSLSTLAIPTVHVISGLVLTEIFASFFLSVSIYLIISAYLKNENNYLTSIATGISLSLAILARQPLLLVILSFPFIFISTKENKYSIDLTKKEFLKFLGVATISSLVLPTWAFSVWGNIQPTSQAWTGLGFSINNLILAFGYAFLNIILVNPNYFDLKKDFSNKIELVVLILISVLLNLTIFKITDAPFGRIISTILPYVSAIYPIICGCLLTTLGFTFFYYYLKKQLSAKNSLDIFFAIAFILVLASCFKVTHQFSTRYVVQAFPLLVLSANLNNKKITARSIISLLIGGILGLVCLERFFI
jgi:4-amino-4-deoxy-L-arabinose transferase-like glycosyltransferase